MGLQAPAGIQSQVGVIDEADSRSPWKCRVHGENKYVRSPLGSPLKQLGAELNLLLLISRFHLHLLHRPVCT